MFTVGQVRETLELSNDEAKSSIISLGLTKRWFEDRDLNTFIVPIFYSNIYKNISYILSKFRDIPQGFNRKVNGLTINQIGYVLNGMNEPWPDVIIATTIQYQLLATENKFYSLDEIMQMKFWNLDPISLEGVSNEILHTN